MSDGALAGVGGAVKKGASEPSAGLWVGVGVGAGGVDACGAGAGAAMESPRRAKMVMVGFMFCVFLDALRQ